MRYFNTSLAILLVLFAFDVVPAMAKGPGSGNHSGGGSQSSGHQSSGKSESGSHESGSNYQDSGKTFSNSGGNAGGGTGFNFNKGSNIGNLKGEGTNSQKSFDARIRPDFSGGKSEGLNNLKSFDARHRPDFTGGKGEGKESWRYRWDNGRWWFWGPEDRWMWYGDDGRWNYYGDSYVVRRPIFDNYSGGPIKIVNPSSSGVTLNYTLNGNLYTIPSGYSQEIQEDRAWVIQFSRGPNLDQARYGLTSGVYTFARTDHGWELFRSDFPPLTAPSPPNAAPANPD